MFGSGASHGIHAQFMTQASALNNGKWIGLLRGAGTRFATWFQAMHKLSRQKSTQCYLLQFSIPNPCTQCQKCIGCAP